MVPIVPSIMSFVARGPLRVVGLFMLGLSFGSFDASKKVFGVILSTPKLIYRKNDPSGPPGILIPSFIGGCAFYSTWGILHWALKPNSKIHYTPNLTISREGLSFLIRDITHNLKAYPYAFKTVSALVCGSVAGLAYSVTNDTLVRRYLENGAIKDQ